MVVLVSLGCGGDSDDPASTPPPDTTRPPPPPAPVGPTDCTAAPVGIFRIVQLRESGACAPSLTETVPGERAHIAFGRRPDGCIGTATMNPATCEARAQIQCPAARNQAQESLCRLYGCAPPVVSIDAALNWKPGWASAIGGVQVSITGVPSGECSSSYSISALRL